jgi:hypothetical protein
VTDRLRAAAVSVAAAGLILTPTLVPFVIPSGGQLVGASSELRTNNGAAYLAFVAFAIACAALIAVWLARSSPRQQRSSSERVRPRILLAAFCVIHVALFAVLYAARGRFVFAEALYFQAPLYRMSLGEIPYVDFSYYYGPAMIYPAHWLSRFASVEAAYGLWFVATYVIGLVLLYASLTFLLASESRAFAWTFAIGIALFNPWTGLNVTFTRFVMPTATLLALLRAMHDQRASALFLAIAGILASFLYTSEAAAVVAVGAVSLGVVETLPSLVRRTAGWIMRADGAPRTTEPAPRSRAMTLVILMLAVGALGSVLVFVAIDPSLRALVRYPESAISYSSGAYNQPVYPHLPFLALAAIVVMGCGGAIVLAALGLRENMYLAAVLTVVTLITVRGALAVGDASHFAYYGLPAILTCLAVAARGGLRQPAVAAFLAVIGLALSLQLYHASVVGLIRPPQTGPFPVPTTALQGDVTNSLREIVKYGGTSSPYLMYGLEYYSLPIYRESQLRYASYYTFSVDLISTDHVARLIDDVRRRRALVVVAADRLRHTAIPVPSNELWNMAALLTDTQLGGAEMNALHARSSARVEAPLIAFIRDEYHEIHSVNGLVLLAPN